MTKPRILLTCRTYLPGYLAGGPVRTLSNLVSALGDEFEFHIVTLDRDYGEEHPYPNVIPGKPVTVGKAQVRYLRPDDVSRQTLDAIIGEVAPDLLYLNSLLDRVFTAPMLQSRAAGAARDIPAIIAPRGQLNPGALRLGRLKKMAYLAWLKRSGKLDGLVWQATGAAEESAIRDALGARFLDRNSRGIGVVPNISFADIAGDEEWEPRVPGSRLRIALLGRVSPMKNIHYAVDVLARMKQPAQLDIFGPVEDETYWQTCQERMQHLPAHASVASKGPVAPALITKTLAPYDCFFLPTQGENFGHAIAEALSAGLPAVISDTTPWSDLEAHEVGRVIPLADPQRFADALDELALLDTEKMRLAHRRCALYAEKTLSDPDILNTARQFFAEGAKRV